MPTAILKAVKMLLSCCPRNNQDAAVLTALKAVQDAEKNHTHKDQVQRLVSITDFIIRLQACLTKPSFEFISSFNCKQ
jgi:hypothetical protein